jgi:hypothetical protein
MLWALLLGGLFLFRRSPTAWNFKMPTTNRPDYFPYTGGAGTGYGVDIYGDEG